MSFIEVVDRVIELLRQRERVSYRVLKREFGLDDEQVEDLKEQLIDVQELAADKDGKMLVWTGGRAPAPLAASTAEHASSPVAPTAPTEPAKTPASHFRSSEAERRQLTVMFVDLVGSTKLAGQLDPEDLRAVVRAYQQTSAEVIERYGGHIAQYLGDGLLVYFGYPTAHEDDAARAVRTGLEIVRALQSLNAQLSTPVQVRIGIHTGPVVVGEMGGGGRQEQLALGEAPNIAARVQGQAQPDEVVISAATYHLVEGLFECEDRGQPALKGVSTPLTLYHVGREGEAQSRFQVIARRGLTPLVGREHEQGLLRERWEQVKDGAGQIVLLSGEPGIGKSRLVEVLKETVEHDGASCLELRCSPYAQNSALQPVIEHLYRRLHLRPDDLPERKLEKLQQALSRYHFPQPDTLPLLAALLSLPQPSDAPPLALSPQKQKEKTHEAVVAWLCQEAQQQAMTYAWEDLHWADPSTLELLTLFLDQVPTTRLFAVLTYRPEFTPPWGSHSYLSHLTLSRLGRRQVETMVEKVTSGKALPAEVVQQIVNKTDGVPLFVEELTKMVVESDLVREVNGHYALNGPLSPLAIPSTLQDSLMARLDRFATVREIAQLGATIGREFPYDLLQAVSPLDTETLQQGLRQLVDSELVFQSGVPPQTRYLFKHALVQDTAYQSLLKSRRQQLHQQVARILEERFAETVETQPELVAHHYTEAGLTEQAIPYWQQAGQRAVQRSAATEAERHLTTALALLKSLPDCSDRAAQEFDLQTALGTVLLSTKGFGAPEVEPPYQRAWELAQHVGDTPQLFPVLFGLWQFWVMRAHFQTTYEQAQRLMSVAQSTQDSAQLVVAHYVLGITASLMGNIVEGHAVFTQGAAVYNPEQHRTLAYTYSFDPGEASLHWAAYDLWNLGYPAQALQHVEEALGVAHGLAHPFSLCFALIFASMIHRFRREVAQAQAYAEEVKALATEHEFPHWRQYGEMLHGWTLAQQGRTAEGIAEIQQGLDGQRAIGTEVGRTLFLTFLVDAYEQAGQPDEGSRALTEALDSAEKRGEGFCEAELYRLKGELILQAHGQSLETRGKEAEGCFQQALEVARRQQAKSWELRAATSLARRWQHQGKTAEARELLAPVYNWFTEGFDTADLKDAKSLLAELS
jgi:class 3 adenylate cyclase/predicted ATPase